MSNIAKDLEVWLLDEAPLPASSVLAETVEKYPYAPLVHFAYLRALQNEDSYKFPAQLSRTSISTMDRQALLDWAEAPLIPVEVQAAAWKEAQKSSSLPTPTASVAPAAPAVPTAPGVSAASVAPAAPVVPEVQPAVPAGEEKPAAKPAAQPESLVDVKPSVASPAVKDVPIPAPAPGVTPPKPVTPKPAAATDLASINLDALPAAVREQILRSRAIQEKFGKAPVAKPSIAPTEKPAVEAVPVKAEKSMAPSIPAPAEKPAAVPAPPAPAAPSASVAPAAPAEPILAAKTEKPAEILEPMSAVAPEGPKDSPKEAALGAADKAPVPDPTLSPFANFLSSLKEESSTVPVPASQRDPAMERAILEQFLEINPKIKPVRDAPLGENLALRTPNVSGLVTETLANHYYDQGMHEKAIQAYEILKLKVPEKSAIFAARISEMRKTQSSTK